MKIAMISTPYLPVPPKGYGGTELIVGLLTDQLVKRGHDVVLYATGDSHTTAALKARYQRSVWPPKSIYMNPVKEIDHVSWAIREAEEWGAEVIHIHCALGIALQSYTKIPMVYTIHHPWDEESCSYYQRYQNVHYVAISDYQRQRHGRLMKLRTIHHGLDLSRYTFQANKEGYLAFLGRIAAVKGVHLAIEAARRAGMRLIIAGDIQPIHRDYFEREVEPRIDGEQIEYIGEADHEMKVDLLKAANALLFPIQWDEPFGLVMIESMACGTPVVAFPGGSVPEIVKNGVSGYIVNSVAEMAAKIAELNTLTPVIIRDYCQRYFSHDRMADEYEAVYQQAAAESRGLKFAARRAS